MTTVTKSEYCKRGYFSWGKFHENVGKTVYLGVFFTILDLISLIKSYWFYFANFTNFEKYSHVKISTFTVHQCLVPKRIINMQTLKILLISFIFASIKHAMPLLFVQIFFKRNIDDWYMMCFEVSVEFSSNICRYQNAKTSLHSEPVNIEIMKYLWLWSILMAISMWSKNVGCLYMRKM